ncbi:MAG: aminopeptidase [Pseudomonadales bacterium]
MHSTASRSPWARLVAGVVVLVAMSAMAGCQTIGYYSHAVLGQWRVLSGRQPVTQVLTALDGRDDARSRQLREQLTLSQKVLDFAETELGLDVGRRYRTYVDLKRPAVVWNLFAAPPLSLQPHTWCYPIVGCAPYRGYFDEALAQRHAAVLAAQGLETYVAPVPAYSTLGWFADPLMSSFIGWPEPDLAELLFHELAHGVVWVPGDVAFNESFATFVGRRGLSEWLVGQGRVDLLEDRRDAALARGRLLDLLERTRAQLAAVYDGDADREHKLEAKARILSALDACYEGHRDGLGGGRYDALMDGLDNARLVSIATYEDQVPAFAGLFDEAGGRWPAFFDRVRGLAELDDPARRAALGSGDEQVADAGDDDGSHEIQCESLARHLLDGETPG